MAQVVPATGLKALAASVGMHACELKVDQPRPAGAIDHDVLLLVEVVVADPGGMQASHGRLEQIEEVEGQPLRAMERGAGNERAREELAGSDAADLPEGGALLLAQGGRGPEAWLASPPTGGHRPLFPPGEQARERSQDHPPVHGAQHELPRRLARALERDPVDGTERVSFHLLLDANGYHAE